MTDAILLILFTQVFQLSNIPFVLADILFFFHVLCIQLLSINQLLAHYSFL